eukprot:4097455-Pyramimonas_sp.AAC.1
MRPPRRLQDRAQTVPGGPKRFPRGPKRPIRDPQKPEETPRAPEEAPRGSRGPQELWPTSASSS